MEWFDRCVAADLMTGVIDVMADVMGVPRVMAVSYTHLTLPTRMVV